MKQVLSLPQSLLDAFRGLPREGALQADELPLSGGRLERLRVARELETARLVETPSKRPKRVRVRHLPFPQGLHAALCDKPHYAPILKGHGLLVVGILATSPRPLPAREISRLANLHPNTVYPILRLLGRRAMLAKARSEYALHEDARDIAQLGRLFLQHRQLQILERFPTCFPLHEHYGRLIIEAPATLEGPPPTAASYFQSHGAPVLAKAPIHAIVVSGAKLTEGDAYEDFLATNPPPRTRQAVESFLQERLG